MIFFWCLIFLFMILSGAILGRMDGGGIVKTPEWVERSLIMFFFVLACAPFASSWALLAFVGVVGIATGHGQYFKNLTIKAIEPEKVDFIVSKIFGPDPRTSSEYAEYRGKELPGFYYGKIASEIDGQERRLLMRNAFGMFCTGFLVGFPAFLLCMAFGQWYGLYFLLTGPNKAASYMLLPTTEYAEYANGAVRNAICFIVLINALGVV